MNSRGIYWVVGGVLAVLLLVMVISFNYNRPTALAEQKAQDLVASYQADGLPAPASVAALARVLGEDGAAVCAAADSALQRGYLKTRLGVGGEFYFRPIQVDRDVLRGFLLVARVYCPQTLSDLEDLYEGLDYADVVDG